MISLKSTIILFVTIQSLKPITTRHTSPTGSILDIIDTKEVARLIAERQENASREEKRYLLQNELDDTYVPLDTDDYEYQKIKPDDEREENPRIEVDLLLKRQNLSDPYKQTENLADLRGFQGRKVLKSSRNALLVTKKEYLQRDWCKTEPLIQKIREEGCLTRAVINRFCYGQCNSFYIPKNPKKKHNKRKMLEETEDEDLNGPAFKSCAFCRPKKFTWITITLRCPSMFPPYRTKRIQRIKQCKCISGSAD